MCPICAASDSAVIAAGIRAGALTLFGVSAIVMGLFARFAWRLWRLRHTGDSNQFPAPEGTS